MSLPIPFNRMSLRSNQLTIARQTGPVQLARSVTFWVLFFKLCIPGEGWQARMISQVCIMQFVWMYHCWWQNAPASQLCLQVFGICRNPMFLIPCLVLLCLTPKKPALNQVLSSQQKVLTQLHLSNAEGHGSFPCRWTAANNSSLASKFYVSITPHNLLSNLLWCQHLLDKLACILFHSVSFESSLTN